MNAEAIEGWFVVAGELAEAETEWAWRTSCNRSYYATFHMLSCIVEQCVAGNPVAPGHCTLGHAEVRGRLARWSSANKNRRLGLALGTRAQMAGDNFQRLMESRQHADYELDVTFSKEMLEAHELRVQKVRSFAESAMEQLAKVSA